MQPKIRLQELVLHWHLPLNVSLTIHGEKKNLCCSFQLDGSGALPKEELEEKAEPDRLGSEHKRKVMWLEVPG